MRERNITGRRGLFLAALLLMGMVSALSACNTVGGAGQDVSAIGKTITSGAEQTKRATGAP
jgi:predicted small secreted protein